MPPQRSAARIRVYPLGDTAVLAELGTRLDTALNTRATALAAAWKKGRGVRRAGAGHGSVTVQFARAQIPVAARAAAIGRLATKRPPMEEPGRLHRIPLVYDGPDLGAVAADLGLSTERVVDLHGKPIHRAFLVGFVPGWGYLGPLPGVLALARPAPP